jgi:hypothetical protein
MKVPLLKICTAKALANYDTVIPLALIATRPRPHSCSLSSIIVFRR